MDIIKCPKCTKPNVFVVYETEEGVIYFKCDHCGALFRENPV